MSKAIDEVVAASRIDPAGGAPGTSGAADNRMPERVPAESVYRRAARSCLPQLQRMLGSAPWFDGVPCRGRPAKQGATALYRQQAAALAIALLLENDPDLARESYLRECVRTSLIRWQLSLQGDGRPSRRGLQRSPLQGALAGLVVLLLSETSGFQTEMLLSDLTAHLNWLARRPRQASWLEAAIICSLADGALLVRDAALLKKARKRLADLLTQQDGEGWFPEQGGADLGRLSLTLDALVRVYRQNNWEELTAPLKRAAAFMGHFVHPDGSFGGGYGSCGTGFLSAYGVELLAAVSPEAASLALVARQRYAQLADQPPADWTDDLSALLAPGLALAASSASPSPGVQASLPCVETGHTYFPNAGLAVFSTKTYHAVVGGKKGGAMKVVWRANGAVLDDPGIAVVFPHRMRTSNRHDHRGYVRVTPRSVVSQSILQAPGWPPRRKWPWAAEVIPSSGSAAREAVRLDGGQDDASPRADRRGLTHDWHQREIEFEDESIRIRDFVRCRLPCQAVVSQSAPPQETNRYLDPGSGEHVPRPPLYAAGGRTVQITRTYRNGQLVDRQFGPH